MTKNIDYLLTKYRMLHELSVRPWRSQEVQQSVFTLSLIVKQYAFGYCTPAINAAILLAESEPLEELGPDALAVKKMQALAHCTHRQYQDALHILDTLHMEYPEDHFIKQLHAYALTEHSSAKKRS